MDKFLTAMKLSGDEEEYYDDDYYDSEPEVEEKPQRVRRESAVHEPIEDDIPEERPKKSSPAMIRSIQGARNKRMAAAMPNSMEICAIKPSSMEDTREVTDTLLENRTVVLNLEGLDVDVAQRIVDFVSGSCYAIKGNLQKISRYIFIITPSSVDISGDFQEMIGGTIGESIGS